MPAHCSGVTNSALQVVSAYENRQAAGVAAPVVNTAASTVAALPPVAAALPPAIPLLPALPAVAIAQTPTVAAVTPVVRAAAGPEVAPSHGALSMWAPA